MAINKPYHRNYRGMVQHNNSGYSSWAYIIDPQYAKQPEHYIRAFLLIQSDLLKLFEYIEPSDQCLTTFSYRIHELFMRTCIEIEANFKAILAENTFTPQKDRFDSDIYNMSVYKKINTTHHLASYKVMLPIWSENQKIFVPFQNWKNSKTKDQKLIWYQAYNESKHDRQEKFKKANLENLLNAISALLILLSSQFETQSFSPGSIGLGVGGYDYYEMESAIGEYFRIQFPDDWTDEEKYDFDWSLLKQEPNRFQQVDYNKIA